MLAPARTRERETSTQRAVALVCSLQQLLARPRDPYGMRWLLVSLHPMAWRSGAHQPASDEPSRVHAFATRMSRWAKSGSWSPSGLRTLGTGQIITRNVPRAVSCCTNSTRLSGTRLRHHSTRGPAKLRTSDTSPADWPSASNQYPLPVPWSSYQYFNLLAAVVY